MFGYPYADIGPKIVPDSLSDEEVLFLTDIFPTGYSGVDWGEVKGGETVAIYGAGPVGLMAAKSAWLRGAGRVVIFDPLQYRLDKAKTVANCDTILWEDNGDNTTDYVRSITGNRGADVCIDAVGFEPKRNFLDRAKAVINLEKGSDKVIEKCL